MKKYLQVILSFFGGLGVGFGAGYYIYTKKLNRRFFDDAAGDANVDAEKEACQEEENCEEKQIFNDPVFIDLKPASEEVKESKDEYKEYKDLASQYSEETPTAPQAPKKTPKKKSGPKYRDITEEEFMKLDDYDKQVITLYSDGYLYDESGQQVHPADTIGRDRFSKFLAGDRDTIHVRNNYITTDFEVVYDPRPSTDVVDYVSTEYFETYDDYPDEE